MWFATAFKYHFTQCLHETRRLKSMISFKTVLFYKDFSFKDFKTCRNNTSLTQPLHHTEYAMTRITMARIFTEFLLLLESPTTSSPPFSRMSLAEPGSLRMPQGDLNQGSYFLQNLLKIKIKFWGSFIKRKISNSHSLWDPLVKIASEDSRHWDSCNLISYTIQELRETSKLIHLESMILKAVGKRGKTLFRHAKARGAGGEGVSQSSAP